MGSEGIAGHVLPPGNDPVEGALNGHEQGRDGDAVCGDGLPLQRNGLVLSQEERAVRIVQGEGELPGTGGHQVCVTRPDAAVGEVFKGSCGDPFGNPLGIALFLHELDG